jgi:hypothetical protein
MVCGFEEKPGGRVAVVGWAKGQVDEVEVRG